MCFSSLFSWLPWTTRSKEPTATVPITLHKDDIIIATLGKCGSGKSNFIDRLLDLPMDDKNRSASKDLRHHDNDLTNAIKVMRMPNHERYGARLVMLDTPGFGDKSLSEEGVVEMIQNFVKTHSGGRRKAPTGIIRFQPIVDNRLPVTDAVSVHSVGTARSKKSPPRQACALVLGKTRLVLVTTMWDKVQATSTETKEKFNKRKQKFAERWRDLLAAGATEAEFDNTNKTAWKIIDDLAYEPPRMQFKWGRGGPPMDSTKYQPQAVQHATPVTAPTVTYHDASDTCNTLGITHAESTPPPAPFDKHPSKD